jgi:hypothetical protein
MTDDPRDELDRALAARLGALAPEGDDTAAAVLAEMRPGLRRARTRHRVARTSVGFGVLAAVVALVAVASSASPRHGRVAVNSSPTTTVASSAGVPKPNESAPHDVTTTTPANRPAPSTTAPSGRPASGPPPTILVVPAPPNFGGARPTTPAPTTPPGPQSLHFSAPGGTLDVTCSSGRLQLVRYTANSGWSGAVHDNSPHEIQVRFTRSSSGAGDEIRTRGDGGDSRIDVKVGSGDCAHLEIETE